MGDFAIEHVAWDFLIVLLGGLIAGIICKRSGVSMLVGYLIIGALLGQGCSGLVSQDDHELEMMANAGALLLLFAVGLEFSIEQLVRLRRYIFLGGACTNVIGNDPSRLHCIHDWIQLGSLRSARSKCISEFYDLGFKSFE